MSDLSLSEVSLYVYNSLMCSITHKIIVESLLQEQVDRTKFGPLEQPPSLQPIQNTATPVPSSVKLETGSNGTPSATSSRNGTPANEMTVRQAFVSIQGRDVFGNEKIPDSSRYFECRNCQRRIAGNRFAAHIDRCLGGRQRK
ncbi:unnamed protein product [Cyberlindnera jadinii]|uniref:SAGA-associated factor 11 n=1 Tax=Cyberlindnera jadinii (strain ATCC 18201 / CBS 1600 / BCRC 20928 / JCM 3617 / NBRC 0987 / NRRL Y-1542) TaxID=983966 RepID=A0A0H5C9N8_CYBJN|nr:unnamed protein product [Cyberlindnera jadinii]